MIQLIRYALQKPVTVLVAVLAIGFFAVLSLRKMPIDIFPRLGTPTIYVAQTYGGLSPEQIESYVTFYYEYHFLYVTGIKAVESRTVQGISLIKLTFHEGTDMSQALGEVVAQVNRSRAFMPPGTVAPFITRFDGGSVPVGQLVFESDTRSLAEIQEQALFKVRPMFSSLPGVSAPPPFGGNQRTIVVKADPDRLSSYRISPDELMLALAQSNTLTPAGSVRMGDQLLITPQNTVVEQFKELENVVLRNHEGRQVLVKDVASVENGADITSGYALINGKRSVYIPVTKRSDASTWQVVQNVRRALPDMQAAVPEDIRVRYEFDQSGYVINALRNLLTEGVLGALLTGLMVLLFLRDWRGALIVVLTIPLALLSAVAMLYLMGQSINIMTLGGLALSIGILVDEATVTIENIHRYLEKGIPRRQAVWEATREIAVAKLLILLCILAVFVPAFFMSGIPGAMFIPLSLAVGLAMAASFLISQTLVPVLANQLGLRTGSPDEAGMERSLPALPNVGQAGAWLFVVATMVASVAGFFFIGKDIFPRADTGQLKVRLRLPDGTRLERTEEATRQLLSLTDSLAGAGQIAISSAFVGVQGSSYPVNVIHLWTSGQHEAVLTVNLKRGRTEELKEQIRETVARQMPHARLSFEPASLVDQVMSQGATTPVEVLVMGRQQAQSQAFAQRIAGALAQQSYLRDVQIGIPVSTPSLRIEYDRLRLGQMGLTIEQVSHAVVAATSSSRFTQPVYWRDPASANAFQIQVELPQSLMNSPEAVENLPVASIDGQTVYLRQVANVRQLSQPGEYDRLNQQRFIPVTANLYQTDLGRGLEGVQRTLASLGEPPAGVKIMLRGQNEVLQSTFSELGNGLLLAVVAIVLLLAASFQSFGLAFIVLTGVPAVLAGAFLLLGLTGQTLNIQSYIGCIMAVGISVANAILFVSRAEYYRQQQHPNPGRQGIADRVRPILMTAGATLAGMLPMALGLGEGGEQVAPLGIAVIGGLLASTLSTLLFLPVIYQSTIGKNAYQDVSLL